MDSELGQVVNAFPGLVCTALPDGNADFVNRRWYEYSGIAPEAARGFGWQRTIHPDDLPQLIVRWMSVEAPDEGRELEARLRRFDGQYRRFSFRRAPIANAAGRIVKWCGIFTDVENQRQAEDSLRESRDRLRLIFEGLPALAIVTSSSGDLIHANRYCLDYLGATFEELKDWERGHSYHPDDRPSVLAAWRHSLETGAPYVIEGRRRRADGVYRWFHTRGFPLRDGKGNIDLWYLLATDFDDLKRADEAVSASERKLKLIINTIPATAWSTRPDGYCDFLNERWLAYAGLSSAEAEGWGWGSAIHPDDVKGLVEYWQGCLASGTPVDTEARMRSHDGVYRWFLFRANPLRDESGEIVQWFGTNIDVDDQKRAEQAVLASEQNLRLIVNTIPGFAWSASNDGAAEFINQQYLEFLGLSEEEARGWGWSSRVHPDDLNRLVSIWANARATGQPAEVEARHRRYDGEYRWLLVRTRPLRDAGGAVVKWYGVCADIEDRKRAEDALLARERSLNEIVNVIPTTAWTTRADGYCDFVNQGWLTYSGLSAEQAIGWGWGSILHPDDVGGLVEHWQFCLASGTPGDTEARMRRHDGEYRWFLFRANPLRDETGTIVKWIGTNIDIDDRKRAEEELRRSEAFLAKGQRLSMTGSLSWRVSTDEMVWSDEAYRIFECDPNLEVTPGLMFSRVHPEDVPTIDEMVKRARSSRRDFEFEFRLLMPDEKVKYVRLVAHGTRNHDGGLEYIGAVQDVTQRRLSDVAIGRARSELAHAARAMSLGTLTASIAHELNQPLSGIITNASTCLRMLAAVPPNVDGALETANRTIRDGNRASEVIVRLRALFEKKEVPPELVDMNDATREVIALLSTELQRKQVMLWPEFATDLPPAMGDRVQLQQVILNLLLNAADAMSDIKDRPKNVVIKTKLDGKDRVCVVVKDVGVGIDPLTANRLFDSFYTTKAGGMGIGLSVSRSIIESHRGHLWAESNDGPGATFTLAIPRMTDDEMGARFDDALRNSTEIVAQSLAGRS